MVRLLASFVVVVILGLGLGGCATAPVASDQMDQAAKAFVPKAGKANIYVFRNEHIGAMVSMDVLLDGKLMGKTGPQTYFLFDVSPGKHTVLSKAENDSSIDLIVEAGKNYFVWQEVKIGVLMARNLLQVVDEGKGRAGVQECKLLASP